MAPALASAYAGQVIGANLPMGSTSSALAQPPRLADLPRHGGVRGRDQMVAEFMTLGLPAMLHPWNWEWNGESRIFKFGIVWECFGMTNGETSEWWILAILATRKGLEFVLWKDVVHQPSFRCSFGGESHKTRQVSAWRVCAPTYAGGVPLQSFLDREQLSLKWGIPVIVPIFPITSWILGKISSPCTMLHVHHDHSLHRAVTVFVLPPWWCPFFSFRTSCSSPLNLLLFEWNLCLPDPRFHDFQLRHRSSFHLASSWGWLPKAIMGFPCQSSGQLLLLLLLELVAVATEFEPHAWECMWPGLAAQQSCCQKLDKAARNRMSSQESRALVVEPSQVRSAEWI